MTDTKAEKLTAEEERRLRGYIADLGGSAWHDLRRVFATLDASRAETEAVRQRSDAFIRNLHALTAEMVEALDWALGKLRPLAAAQWKPDDPAWQDMERARSYLKLKSARAQGIREKEKADRTLHICPRCGTLNRGDNRHACMEKPNA